MPTVDIDKILYQKKALFLACDQGLEHGPKDFNLRNISPTYILHIALEGGYQGVVFQAGIAEKYHKEVYKDVPLIVKLNGKTILTDNEPYSPQVCSVERAVKLGAAAVGYTIYPGSEKEPEMFREFGRIVEQAHDYGIPVIAWIYPRGKNIKNDLDTDVLAYSARIGLELGADIIKMKYNGDPKALEWMSKCAGRAKIVISGGSKMSEDKLLKQAHELINNGAIGMAIGRNVWQHDRPFAITRALQGIIFKGMSLEKAKEYIK